MDIENRIIRGCKKFNKIAQKELYNRYVPVMWAICLRYAADKMEAKDIMQEGFIKIFSRIKQYKGEGSFEGWMKRIMVNTAISTYHKNKKWLESPSIDEVKESSYVNEIENGFDDYVEIDKNDIDKDKISYNLIEEAQFTEEELRLALDSVPEAYRVVFNLYHIEEYKHKEIASMLNIDENTSRTRLMRAKSLLQKHLYKMSIDKLGR